MTDEEAYDVIVMGTGLKECILSGLLSVDKKKVLHVDRNDFYGAESASLNLKSLKKNLDGLSDEDARKWCDENKEEGKAFGRWRDYNVDLCPKLIMANGNLVKMLIHTTVTKYLDFNVVDGSFIYQKSDAKLHEVPTNPSAVWKSGLVGMTQKYRFKSFLQWVIGIDPENPKTWDKCDLKNDTMFKVYEYWKCGNEIKEVCGHAIALYPNDDYMNKAKFTLPCLQRIQLYYTSLLAYSGSSPYIYPLYGLGGLPEGFSRLAAVYGGTYMLRTPVEEVLYDDDGKVKGIKYVSPETKKVQTAYCKQLIGDPTYFEGTDKRKFTGYIARVIAVLKEMPELKDKKPGDYGSCQVIFPSTQTGHTNDIYVSILGSALQCTPQGRYICCMQTRFSLAEDASPDEALAKAKSVLEISKGKLGDTVIDSWTTYRKSYVPANQKAADNVYIPSSMDATTHFGNATTEVLNIFHAMTGKPVDLSAKASDLAKEPE